MENAFRYKYIILAVVITFSSIGCSLEKLAIKSTGAVINYGVESLYEEEDLVIAETAIMANLKLLEGLIKGDPKSTSLLLMAAQGFTGYALGFVEDEEPERAKIFYKRGMDYGLRILYKKRVFEEGMSSSFEDLEKSLSVFHKADVPALFWTCNAWGSWINLNRSSPKAIAEMGKVELVMKKTLELDEEYNYGGAHLFFSSFYGGRSKMFGGDPVKAKHHFDRFMEISGGKFLMGQVLFAKFYAVQMQDSGLYRDLLEGVLAADDGLLPDQRLVNEMARAKAAKLLDDIDMYF